MLDGVRILEGDCLSVLPTLPDACVDCCITDPPYGITATQHYGRTGSRIHERYVTIQGDDDTEVGIRALDLVRARGWPLVAFASPERSWPGQWKELLVWDKGGAVGGGGDTRRTHRRTWELIQCWGTTLHAGRAEAVLRYPMGIGARKHPAEKSLALMRYLVRQFTPPGGLVVDPFAGSGTTGIACLLEGRRFLGIELSPEYVAIARKRIAAEASRYPLFAAGGA